MKAVQPYAVYGLALACVLIFSVAAGCTSFVRGGRHGIVLNDLHSRLNPTRVAEVVSPRSTTDVVEAVRRAVREGRAISISGGRHAAGGQQFGEGTLHLDTSKLDDVLAFDRERGIVRVEAGIQWRALLEYLWLTQKGESPQWSIVQKQTGADCLSIGGALSSNIHGRGVNYKPIIQDVEAFTLVDARGDVLDVSRTSNPELFRLVIGGYGLFGVITTVGLRLQQRKKLERVVEVIALDALHALSVQRINDGFLYGDYQFKTDAAAPDFLQTGVFATYKPVPMNTPIHMTRKRLGGKGWKRLIGLAHSDKARAFKLYSDYYLTTNGQIYWSDKMQLSYYDDGYEKAVKAAMPVYEKGSLMITEVYVPHDHIVAFMKVSAADFKAHDVNLIYGTVRMIRRDDESFLAWANKDYACIIFNLRIVHTDGDIQKAQADFQRIIDRALEFDGSYYLTYHRWARRDQVLKAYPQFPRFLELKRKYDPNERFQSEWYRHYKRMFADP